VPPLSATKEGALCLKVTRERGNLALKVSSDL
jgi:hypothetical protein